MNRFAGKKSRRGLGGVEGVGLAGGGGMGLGKEAGVGLVE